MRASRAGDWLTVRVPSHSRYPGPGRVRNHVRGTAHDTNLLAESGIELPLPPGASPRDGDFVSKFGRGAQPAQRRAALAVTVALTAAG